MGCDGAATAFKASSYWRGKEHRKGVAWARRNQAVGNKVEQGGEGTTCSQAAQDMYKRNAASIRELARVCVGVNQGPVWGQPAGMPTSGRRGLPSPAGRLSHEALRSRIMGRLKPAVLSSTPKCSSLFAASGEVRLSGPTGKIGTPDHGSSQLVTSPGQGRLSAATPSLDSGMQPTSSTPPAHPTQLPAHLWKKEPGGAWSRLILQAAER